MFKNMKIGMRLGADFIAGMGKVNNRSVIIPDIQSVLSTEEMAALANLAERTGSDSEEAVA